MNRLISNLILGFFILVLVVVYSVVKQPAIYSLTTPAVKDGGRQAVLPNGAVINVAVADDESERIQGLSGVEKLPEDEGMLLAFPYAGQHGIWMKEMNFPIDILWLDEDGRVVNVVEHAPVPEEEKADSELVIYHNDEPAKYVLELAAGMARNAGIDVGARITLS